MENKRLGFRRQDSGKPTENGGTDDVEIPNRKRYPLAELSKNEKAGGKPEPVEEGEKHWFTHRPIANPHHDSDETEESEGGNETVQDNGSDDKPQTVELNRKIGRTNQTSDSFYLIPTKEFVLLPPDTDVMAKFLHVDSNDVLYFRCDALDDEEEEIESVGLQWTFGTLLSCMAAFYSNFKNRATYSVGQSLWIPDHWEVVVVKLRKRIVLDWMGAKLKKYGHTVEYHRAVIEQLSEENASVRLIDTYGIGTVSLSDIFRIVPMFTVLPPQMFECELAGFWLLHDRKMIQKILRDHPIPKLWPDCEMNDVTIKWLGEYSTKKRPLIEVIIHTRSLNVPTSVPLSTYLYRHLQNLLQPFHRLTDRPAVADVLHASSTGFLWLKFLEDEVLLSRMQCILERLLPCYYFLLSHCHLNVQNIHPREHDRDSVMRTQKNLTQLYVTCLEGVEPGKPRDFKSLYRVGIKDVLHKSNQVEVNCIDYLATRVVRPSQLLPLHHLYPSMLCIPPLVCKFHLHGIKQIDLSHPAVGGELLKKKYNIKMIHKWPNNVFPPEITIDALSPIESGVRDLEWFIANECFKILNEREKDLLSKKIMEKCLEKIEKNEDTEIGDVSKYREFEENIPFVSGVFKFQRKSLGMDGSHTAILFDTESSNYDLVDN